MNLCPFAAQALGDNRVRLAVTPSDSEERLLEALDAELALLDADRGIETTLLIHPDVLTDFSDFNQFLDLVDLLIGETGNDGVFQVASFHPAYQFAGTSEDDAENYTNRSPYPILHILREEQLERAIASYPDIDRVPEKNIELMNELGREQLRVILEDCLPAASADDTNVR